MNPENIKNIAVLGAGVMGHSIAQVFAQNGYVEIDHPGRLVITHWFSPPSIIPLVEVIPGPDTSDEVIALIFALLKTLGKKPVMLKEFVPAFIVNRVQDAINKTVLEMIENDYATFEEIDIAIKNTLGIRLPIVGVIQSLDFAGLDLINGIIQRLGIKSTFLEEKVANGHLGVKTSKGIYDYDNRNEAEILKKRDGLYLKLRDYLEKIDAFEPV